MTNGDAKTAAKAAAADGSLRLTKHARDRMQERGIQASDVREAMKTAGRIELNKEVTDPREKWKLWGTTEDGIVLCMVFKIDEDGVVWLVTLMKT